MPRKVSTVQNDSKSLSEKFQNMSTTIRATNLYESNIQYRTVYNECRSRNSTI